MRRIRVFTAVIRGDDVLMVHHVHDGSDYWTLPGGGVEPGESAIAAAAREVFEETGIRARELRLLFTDGDESCFLASCLASDIAVVGSDPELSPDRQLIQDVRWFALADVREDVQVARVLRALETHVSVR